MNGLVDKMKGLFIDPVDLVDGDYNEYDDPYRSSDYAESRPESEWRSSSRRRQTAAPTSPAPSMTSNVVSMPGISQQTGEVVVMEPRSFDEMPAVIRALRDRKSVVMNLTRMDAAEAQRSVDFVAGGTYAIDGHQERIGENIFLFTPSCVAVSVPGQTPAVNPASPSRSIPSPTPIWNSSAAFDESVPAVGGYR